MQMLFDKAAIEAALKLFIQPKCVFEIRILEASTSKDRFPKTYFGYFNDQCKAAQAIAAMGFVSWKGCYFTPNPVKPELLARAVNKLIGATKDAATTTDEQVVSRKWLLLDFDPIRPKGIATSDDELEQTRQISNEVDSFLSEIGFPKPIFAMSGNGYHLNFAIDLPCRDDGLIERCLKALAQKFNSKGIKVDESVFNPSRIWKLYGTMSGKGDPDAATLNPPRLQRMSKVLDAPDSFEIVPVEVLERLAALAPLPETTTNSLSNHFCTPNGFDLDALLAKSSLELRGPAPYVGGRKWIIEKCPWNFEHTGGSAFIIQRVDGVIQAGCHHNSCSNYKWHDLRDIIDPGWRARKPNKKSSTELKRSPVVICMADVQPEEISWLWPSRIPYGKVTLFCGDPGLGKSFATLDIASRVSQGFSWPDYPDSPISIRSVLLLNSEDGKSDTIQPRLVKMGADLRKIHIFDAVRSGESEQQFSLSTDIEILEQAANELGGCKLIIIDPITSYLGGINGDKTSEVRGVLDPLKGLAERTGAAIILVNHLNKGNGSALYRALGSISFIGMVRSAWVFAKCRVDEDRRLMLPLKNNIAANSRGMAFSIDEGAIAWEAEPVDITADEALAFDAKPGRKPEARNEAKTFLESSLADGNWKLQTDIEAEAQQRRISWGTIKRAKRDLNIESANDGFGKPWSWRLPLRADQESSDSLSI